MEPKDPPDTVASEQWQRHHQDEVRAIAAQQQRAGQTHEPVGGPPPYGNEQVNLIAEEIIRRERDDCARLVETWPVGDDAPAVELLREVAAAIRHRS